MEVKPNDRKKIERKSLDVVKSYVVRHSYSLKLLGIVIAVIIFFSFSFIFYDNKSIKEYLNSEIFKTVIISIGLPIILYLWRDYDNGRKQREEELKKEREQREEELKKEREQREEELKKEREQREEELKKEREQREEELKEKRKRREQELKDKRFTSIEKTFEEWDQINSLISQVRFCEGKNDPKLKDVQLKIAEHSISFGKIIFYWSERFPVIPDSIISMFVKYTVTLYWGAWAVAYCIRNHDREIKELQESLGIFQRGIISIAFLNLTYILKDSSKLLEYIEENMEYDGDTQIIIINAIKGLIEDKLNKNFGKNEEDSLFMKIYKNKNRQFNKDSYNFIMDQLLEYKQNIPSSDDIKVFIEKNEQLKNFQMDWQTIITIISNLMKSAYILKMNELLLGIDLFWSGAITHNFLRSLRPSKSAEHNLLDDNKGPNDDENLTGNLSIIYEKIIDKIDNIKIEDERPSKDKASDNNYNPYQGLFKSDDYQNFVDIFYKMRSDKLMDIVANSSINYIKIVGRTIRLERMIFSDDLSPVN